MRRDRRGVSEVIAALLILIIAVALGTVFFAYGTTVLSGVQDLFGLRVEESKDRIEERMTITASFNNSSHVCVALYNYGRRTATVASLYVNNTQYEDGDILITGLDPNSTTLTSKHVSVEELRWACINLGYKANGESEILVATERGNTFEVVHDGS